MARVWRKGNPLTVLVGMQAGMGFPDSSVGKESAGNAGDPGSIPGVRRIHWRRDRLPTPYSWAFLVAQLVKNPPVGDLGSTPGVGRSPGEGKGYPLQYSCLENSMDGGAW